MLSPTALAVLDGQDPIEYLTAEWGRPSEDKLLEELARKKGLPTEAFIHDIGAYFESKRDGTYLRVPGWAIPTVEGYCTTRALQAQQAEVKASQPVGPAICKTKPPKIGRRNHMKRRH
jgi:hypothetical protein